MLWWPTNNISLWPDEVVWSKVEQLIVEGVAKAGKEGSVCQAAGWGYPWLTALPPCLASSITVNEITSLTQLEETQWREQARGLCLYILSTCFHFLHLLLSSWNENTFPLQCSDLNLFPHVPLWHSIFAFFPYLNYFFISYLTLSTFSPTVTGEEIHHQQSYILNQDTRPDILLRNFTACDT